MTLGCPVIFQIDRRPATNSVTLRGAILADQAQIKKIIYTVGINPTGLAWQRFLLAESDGSVIGTGQVKPHSDGSRELASIAVIPTYQHRGIASQIIRRLLDNETCPLYLMCRSSLEPFYQRFGFRIIPAEQMPPTFRRIYRAIRIFRVVERFVGRDLNIIIMCREAPLAAPE